MRVVEGYLAEKIRVTSGINLSTIERVGWVLVVRKTIKATSHINTHPIEVKEQKRKEEVYTSIKP